LFTEYGEISSAKVITDKMTGRSRGFGFVEMPNEEEAKKAIDELNQAQFDGKVINVNEAKPREDRPSGGFNRGGGYNRGGGLTGGGERRGGLRRWRKTLLINSSCLGVLTIRKMF
jgi:RNA recognition motif-containing protein